MEGSGGRDCVAALGGAGRDAAEASQASLVVRSGQSGGPCTHPDSTKNAPTTTLICEKSFRMMGSLVAHAMK
jgi:hypothetical protein